MKKWCCQLNFQAVTCGPCLGRMWPCGICLNSKKRGGSRSDGESQHSFQLWWDDAYPDHTWLLSGMLGLQGLMSFSHFPIWSLTFRIPVKFFSNPCQTGRIKGALLFIPQITYKVKQQQAKVLTGESCTPSKRFIALAWLLGQKELWNHKEVSWPWNPETHSTNNQPWMFYIQVRKRKTPKLEMGVVLYDTQYTIYNVLSKGMERSCRCFYFRCGHTLKYALWENTATDPSKDEQTQTNLLSCCCIPIHIILSGNNKKL